MAATWCRISRYQVSRMLSGQLHTKLPKNGLINVEQIAGLLANYPADQQEFIKTSMSTGK